MDNRPIGLLDSGVGGLTVARELLRQLPNEEIVYIGDTRRAPYGPRSREQIIAFTWDMVNFLLSKDVKMIVMACNTAKTKTNKIGVIATQASIRSDEYHKTIARKSSAVEVYSLACPKFVSIVESNEMESEIARKVVSESLVPLIGKVDTLILGCTHYPLLRSLIQETMGKEVRLIDSGAEAVRDISVLLNYFSINGQERQPLEHRFYTTAGVNSFREIAEKWLNIGQLQIEHTEIENFNKEK